MVNGITTQILLTTLELTKDKNNKWTVCLERMVVHLIMLQFQAPLFNKKLSLKEVSLDIMKKVEANMDMLQRVRFFIKDKVVLSKRDPRLTKDIMLGHIQVKLNLKLDLKSVNKKVFYQSTTCKDLMNKFQIIIKLSLKLLQNHKYLKFNLKLNLLHHHKNQMFRKR